MTARKPRPAPSKPLEVGVPAEVAKRASAAKVAKKPAKVEKKAAEAVAEAAPKAPKRGKKGAAAATARAPKVAVARDGRSLVIVESPAKAKTVGKYLGSKFVVRASKGHVKDLPKSKLGVDIENSFTPQFVPIKGRADILEELRELADRAPEVYLATDPDREGEAIGYHLAQELKVPASRVKRILVREITKKGLQAAMAAPEQIDANRVEAQITRRILDRLVGYQISPLLWKKVRRGLSAGRVQSVAVRLMCEREAEIKAFIPVEYWTVGAIFRAANPPPFAARVTSRLDGTKLEPKTAAESEAITAELKGASFRVHAVQKREQKRMPPAPLTTSKLQQAAFGRYGFTAKRTMQIAQTLYEGIRLGEEGETGLITYMRTDSLRVSPDAQVEARTYITKAFGEPYLPEQPPVYKGKGAIQDAHEAIRPTTVERTPESVRAFLDEGQFKLYRLVWERFVASQMMPARVEQTAVDVAGGTIVLRASGSVVLFPGFMALLRPERKGEPKEGEAKPGEAKPGDAKEAEGVEEGVDEVQEGILPPLAEGEAVTLSDLSGEQHFTQPPPRFNDASIVKRLEEDGIGRPSTYAPTIAVVIDRGYVERLESRLKPTELGSMVNDLLLASFPDILEVKFTAQMEDELDKVEEGAMTRLRVLQDFYTPFKIDLDRALPRMDEARRELGAPTDIPCDKCGKMMIVKWGRHGKFLACPGYPECKSTKNIGEDGKPIAPETTTEICQKCQAPMAIKFSRFGKFLACTKYPECKGTRSIGVGVKCPKVCGGDVVARKSRRGRPFYGCQNYPTCDFVSWDKPVARACPTCQATYLLDKWTKTKGKFVKCSNKECPFEELAEQVPVGADS